MDTSLLPNITVIDLNTLEDIYLRDRVKSLLMAKSVKEVKIIVNNIYVEGFEDGVSSVEKKYMD